MRDAELHSRAYGHPDNELVRALEPDQIVAAASRSLSRYVLSRRENVALWALRVFVLIITALVIYTFVVSLR